MNNIRYTIDEKRTKRAIKSAYRKQQFKRNLSKMGKWIVDNKQMVLVLGPAVIGLATVVTKAGVGVVKGLVRHINLRNEKKVKDFYCYDRSLGHYWALRRELSNREWTEIDKRKKNGERLADILNELHVLK